VVRWILLFFNNFPLCDFEPKSLFFFPRFSALRAALRTNSISKLKQDRRHLEMSTGLAQQQHESRLAQIYNEENTEEAQRLRNEMRNVYVRTKDHENRMLNRRRWNNNNSAVHMRQSYRLSEQEKTILSFYEAQCAAQIKKRQSIVFDNGSVVPDQKLNVPVASPAVVAELTKWVKIALSRKKKVCCDCGGRCFPQRCRIECQFFTSEVGCMAGELCHARHVGPDLFENSDLSVVEQRPLFLGSKSIN